MAEAAETSTTSLWRCEAWAKLPEYVINRDII
jgi:hypothetical protein